MGVFWACFGRVFIFKKFQTHRPYDAILRLFAIHLRSSTRLLRSVQLPPAAWRTLLLLRFFFVRFRIPRRLRVLRAGVAVCLCLATADPRDMAWGLIPDVLARFVLNRAKDRPPPGASVPASHPTRHLARTRGFFPARPDASRDRRAGDARDRDQVRARRARDRTWHGDVARGNTALNPPSEATLPPPRRSPSLPDIFPTVVVFPPFPHWAAVGPRGRAIRPARADISGSSCVVW